jgi:hypothetical protein
MQLPHVVIFGDVRMYVYAAKPVSNPREHSLTGEMDGRSGLGVLTFFLSCGYTWVVYEPKPKLS